MAENEEISRMNAEISQLEASIHKARARLPHARKLRADIEGCLGAEKSALNLANSNIRHMRFVADHVVLREWVEVLLIAETKTESVYRKQLELAHVSAEIGGIEELLPELELQKRLRVEKLAEYGQVHYLKQK